MIDNLKKSWLNAAVLIAIIFVGNKYLSLQETRQALAEQKQKQEYAAKQKAACLNIYEVESKKYNNVRGWEYLGKDDKCEITYKETRPLKIDQCQQKYPLVEKGEYDLFMKLRFLCVEGLFTQRF